MSRLGHHSAVAVLVVLVFYLLIVVVVVDVCHVCSNWNRIDCLACLTSIDFATEVLEHVAVEVVEEVLRLVDDLKTMMMTRTRMKTYFLKLSFAFESWHSRSWYLRKWTNSF